MAKKHKTKKVAPTQGVRMRKLPTGLRARLKRQPKPPMPKLKSSWGILKDSLVVIRQNPRIFGGILAAYAILSLVLVKGFSSTAQLGLAKANLQANTSASTFDKGTTLLGNLFSDSGGAATASASTYQSLLIILMSLVIIWVLRQIYAEEVTNKKISVRDAFYKSSFPLVPFVLVLVVISLQLVPFLAGSALYSTVITNSIAVNVIEQIVWGGLFFLLATWSLYMLGASLFGLYIVTLPDVRPLQALRSAKELVKYRRWEMVRKLIFLPIILLIIISVIMLPVVLWLTFIAEWVFFVLSLGILIVVHSYMYRLYRELL